MKKFDSKIDIVHNHYMQLEEKMNHLTDPSELEKVGREYSSLKDVVNKISKYKELKTSIIDTESLLEEETDSEMKNLAMEELHDMQKQVEELQNDIKIALIPKDIADDKNVIIEIRAGTGGDEAALFAGNLLRMYQKYAENNRWKFEILSISETDIMGIKEVTASISGTNVFARLKFESGTHRVQRVPSTESSGRIHTSAATVAVLPEAEEVDVKIEDKDIRIDVFRASGPGGQSVNTTDSAVRITHIPTGIIVSQQDEKSQIKNRAKAMKVLRARLFELEREKLESERSATRKQQVGSGDRSERIRTYNFPQGRVSDHRINLTLYKIDAIVYEGDLDELIDGLIADNQIQKLEALEE